MTSVLILGVSRRKGWTSTSRVERLSISATALVSSFLDHILLIPATSGNGVRKGTSGRLRTDK